MLDFALLMEEHVWLPDILLTTMHDSFEGPSVVKKKGLPVGFRGETEVKKEQTQKKRK